MRDFIECYLLRYEDRARAHNIQFNGSNFKCAQYCILNAHNNRHKMRSNKIKCNQNCKLYSKANTLIWNSFNRKHPFRREKRKYKNYWIRFCVDRSFFQHSFSLVSFTKIDEDTKKIYTMACGAHTDEQVCNRNKGRKCMDFHLSLSTRANGNERINCPT